MHISVSVVHGVHFLFGLLFLLMFFFFLKVCVWLGCLIKRREIFLWGKKMRFNLVWWKSMCLASCNHLQVYFLLKNLVNYNLEKVEQQVTKKKLWFQVAPLTLLPKNLGNMYCVLLYASFATFLHTKIHMFDGKRLLMFSYGSGFTSNPFSFKVC